MRHAAHELLVRLPNAGTGGVVAIRIPGVAAVVRRGEQRARKIALADGMDASARKFIETELAFHAAALIDLGLVFEAATIQLPLLRVVVLWGGNGEAIRVFAELPAKAVAHRQPIRATFRLRFHILHKG